MSKKTVTQVTTEYEKVNGLPGTGKTTYLINQFQHLLNEGVPIEKIGFLGFTRAACDEALQRAKKICPELENGKRYWIRTIHATCFYLGICNGMFLGKKVAGYEHTKKFCEQCGLEPPKVDDDNAEGGDVSSGTAFFSTQSFLVNTFTDVSEWQNCPHSDVLVKLHVDFPDLVEAWKVFKRQYNLIDFNDMLSEIYSYTYPNGEKLNMPVEYLFADEYQDNSPLQDALIKQFSIGKKKVWIAGDANQAIYEFQGAKPTLLLNFKTGREVTLPKSYRCPEEIWSKAQELIKLNETRTNTDGVASRGSGGLYKKIKADARSFEDLIDLIDGSGTTYFLLRTNYLAKNISWKLAENGILFKYLDGEKEKLFGWTKKKLEVLNTALKQSTDVWARNRTLERVGREKNMSETTIRWLQYYVKYSYPFNTKNCKVFIGTIHSAKGREADTVILFDSITGRVIDGLETVEGQEAERRCWYVAISRARQKLYVVNDYFAWHREVKKMRIYPYFLP